MELSCTIAPGLSPMDRGYVEDLLAERLQEELGAEVEMIGGGTLLGDPPLSDFQFELGGCEAEAVARVWQAVFSGIPFTLATTVTLSLDDGEPRSITVGGPAECG
ncbi:MAG: hypothetical protein EP330_27760 [Deltaproteobacteria bacterium]|nr:MAG: hypothetical protein EP330_27760 [Deltaproteobacteria bacterium]